MDEETKAIERINEARRRCDAYKIARFYRDHKTAAMDPYIANVVVSQTKRDMDEAIRFNRSQFKVIDGGKL